MRSIRYVINSPILTDWGKYDYKKISVKEAKHFLSTDFISAVGHKSTAQFLSLLTGVNIPVNRVAIKMKTGDIALVFKLKVRLPEGVVLTEKELQEVPYELGLLVKEA